MDVKNLIPQAVLRRFSIIIICGSQDRSVSITENAEKWENTEQEVARQGLKQGTMKEPQRHSGIMKVWESERSIFKL